MQQQEKVDPKDLIIIITTSPVQSNPATDIIDMAINSIKEQPSLVDIPITIICDGAKVIQQNWSKYKSGIISKESQQKYEKFKQNLKQKYQKDQQITIIERTQRYCFAQNIKYVMQQASQPFVLVFQHDHMLLRKIDFHLVVSTMQKHPINYIGFMNKSVNKLPFTLDQNANLRKYFTNLTNYQCKTAKHNHQQFIEKVLAYYSQLYGLRLMPLIFWYDKIHVAKKSYYLEVIFNKKGYYDELKKSYQKTVSFVEDSYGTATMKAIRNRPQKFQEINSFIWWDNLEPALFHIHGRGFLTQQQKQDLYLKNLKDKQSESEKSSSESGQLNADFFEENSP